jgi:sec-independent protein translocase protein TatA
MGLGFGEIALILLAVLILFGAGKLPTVMGQFGKGLKNFKKELSNFNGENDKK